MAGRLTQCNADPAYGSRRYSSLFIKVYVRCNGGDRLWHGLCYFKGYNSLKFNKIARGLGGLDRQSIVAGHYPSGIINERLFVVMDKRKSVPGVFERLGAYDFNASKDPLMMVDDYRKLMNYLQFISLG
jgi:hypothetical protein